MRIRVRDACFLISGLLLSANAFTLNGPLPFRITTQPPRGVYGESRDVPSFRASHATKHALESNQKPIRHRFQETLKFAKSEGLPWVIMMGIFLCDKGLRKSYLFPFEVPGQNNIIYSTISATLLKTSTSKHAKGQGLVIAGLLLIHLISNLGSFAQLLQTSFASFTTWYIACLNSSPLVTKAITTAVIGVTGDTSAQLLEERIRARKSEDSFSFKNWDRRRMATTVFDGMLVTGPLMHFAYNFLETLLPVAGAGALAASVAAISQVFLDNFILDSLFVGLMFVTTSIGEGCVRTLIPQFKKDYVGAVKASWATSFCLMPLAFACFRFLPVSFRVLGMNFIDIIWTCVVSYMVHRRRRGVLHEQPTPVAA